MRATVAVLGTAVVVILLTGGCNTPVVGPTPGLAPTDQVAQPTVRAPQIALNSANGVTAKASGGGHFHLTLASGLDTDVQFAFTAVQQDASGDAVGNFHFASSPPEGTAVEIHGRITCMTTDPANPGRAWMGGVITKNESQHPAFIGDTKEVGDDAWFRVVDYGEGGNGLQTDRTTSIFFEPTGGFHSGRAFCESQLWFPDDRLTNPLLNGNIQVKH